MLGTEIKLLAMAAGLGSLAGIANEIRTGRKLTFAQVAKSMFLSAFCAVGLFFATYDAMQGRIKMMLFLCILAGLGAGELLNLGAAVIVRFAQRKAGGIPSSKE